jgi:hypothetical protein
MEIDFCAHVGDSAYADDDPGVARSASGGAALITRQACGVRGDETKIGAALSQI